MITALEYIHLPSIGKIEDCRAMSDSFYPIVKKLFDNNNIEGYRLSVVHDLSIVDYHGLNGTYEHITKDVFPFLYIAIQPVQNAGISEFTSLITKDFIALKNKFGL